MTTIPLGTKIKTLRKLKKLTQSEVAQHLNINVPTYSKYENNIYQPKEETLRTIAQILGVDIATFYDETRFNIARSIDIDQLIDWNVPISNTMLNDIENKNVLNLINILEKFNYSCEPRHTTITNNLNLIVSNQQCLFNLTEDEINNFYKNIEHYIHLLITEQLYKQCKK